MSRIDDLKDEIIHLTGEHISALVNAQAAEKLAQQAESLGVEAFGRKAARAAADAAKQKRLSLESELAAARDALAIEEKLEQVPAIQARLVQAQKLKVERIKIARDVQAALDNLSANLRALDVNSAAFHAVERSPDEHGAAAVGGRDFHICNLAARLREPLHQALRKTTYVRLSRGVLLPQFAVSDFSQAEAQVGAALCRHLEEELARIGELRREQIA